MTKLNIDSLIENAVLGKSRWELDNIVYNDRTSNPITLLAFLKRIKYLSQLSDISASDKKELDILVDLSNDLDEESCQLLLSGGDEVSQQQFIENIARQGALETLCKNEVSIATMTAMCKLNPSDFILAAKRSQDLINSIRELVIQGETLSNDVAGA